MTQKQLVLQNTVYKNHRTLLKVLCYYINYYTRPPALSTQGISRQKQYNCNNLYYREIKIFQKLLNGLKALTISKTALPVLNTIDTTVTAN